MAEENYDNGDRARSRMGRIAGFRDTIQNIWDEIDYAPKNQEEELAQKERAKDRLRVLQRDIDSFINNELS